MSQNLEKHQNIPEIIGFNINVKCFLWKA